MKYLEISLIRSIFAKVLLDFEFFSKSSLEVGSILHQPLFCFWGLEAIDKLEPLNSLDSLENLEVLEVIEVIENLETLSIFL